MRGDRDKELYTEYHWSPNIIWDFWEVVLLWNEFNSNQRDRIPNVQSWLKILWIIFSPKGAKITSKTAVVRNSKEEQSEEGDDILPLKLPWDWLGDKKHFVALVIQHNTHRLL